MLSNRFSPRDAHDCRGKLCAAGGARDAQYEDESTRTSIVEKDSACCTKYIARRRAHLTSDSRCLIVELWCELQRVEYSMHHS